MVWLSGNILWERNVIYGCYLGQLNSYRIMVK